MGKNCLLRRSEFLIPLLSFMEYECRLFQPCENVMSEQQRNKFAKYSKLVLDGLNELSSDTFEQVDQYFESLSKEDYSSFNGLEKLGFAFIEAAVDRDYFQKLMIILNVKLQNHALKEIFNQYNNSKSSNGELSVFCGLDDSVPCNIMEAEETILLLLHEATELGSAIRSLLPADILERNICEIPTKENFVTAKSESSTEKQSEPPSLRVLPPVKYFKRPELKNPTSSVDVEFEENFRLSNEPFSTTPTAPALGEFLKRHAFVCRQRDQLVQMRMDSIRADLVSASREHEVKRRPSDSSNEAEPAVVTTATTATTADLIDADTEKRQQIFNKLKCEVVENAFFANQTS